jgi:hypothetical protein
MGGEFKNCGLKNAEAVVEQMCAGESGQINLLSAFIRKKVKGKLWAAAKAKRWDLIALYYNGESYKKNAYDKKMEQAYEKYKTV